MYLQKTMSSRTRQDGGHKVIDKCAGTTATLTSDPFQLGPAASGSFSASVSLPGYFPVTPATSSAVLVNDGDPDDPGKCPRPVVRVGP